MEKNLAEILQTLIAKAQFNTEGEHDETLDKLRELAPDVIPPKPTDANAPPEPAPAPDPGPVAEPVPAQEQVPPPTSPEVAGAAPEQSNAFGSDASA